MKISAIICFTVIFINEINCGDSDSAVKCRHRRNDLVFQTVKEFTDYNCAICYWFMAYVTTAWYDPKRVQDLEVCARTGTNETYMCHTSLQCTDHYSCQKFEYNKLNESDPNNDYYLREFSNEFHMNVFLDCCAQSKQCCEKLRNMDSEEANGNGKKCPAKWDGWMCWDSAEAGTISRQKCPPPSTAPLDHTPTECSNEHASKECYPNATWRVLWHDDISSEYTDYFRCSTPGATERIRQTHVSISIYFISLASAIIGIIIFVIYRQYHIIRVQIHINFFVSLILTAFFSILFHFLVRARHYKLISVISVNPWWCKALLTLSKTARLTNYCWMLNEGIYLHKLIVDAFKDQSKMRYFLLFGWIVPVLVIIPYVVVHSMTEYDYDCWTASMGYLELIYNILPLACVAINIILLVNIIRVLMTKLTGSPAHFRAGIRASLVLLPIFGIQYAFYVYPVEPLDTCTAASFIWKYIQITVEGLQGAMVTTIFCFLNAEVHTQFRRTIRRRFKASRSIVTEEQNMNEIGNL